MPSHREIRETRFLLPFLIKKNLNACIEPQFDKLQLYAYFIDFVKVVCLSLDC